MNDREKLLKTWDIEKLKSRATGFLIFIGIYLFTAVLAFAMAFKITYWLFFVTAVFLFCCFYYYDLYKETKKIIKDKQDKNS